MTTGCWDRTEINTLGIVDSFAVDKKGELYEVIIELINPSGLARQEGGAQKKTVIQNATGTTIFAAVRNLNFFLTRKPYISHNRVFIVGEELARDSIGEAIDFARRDPEVRRTVFVILARGDIREIFQTRGRLEKTIGMQITKIIADHWTTSYLPMIDLNDFSSAMSSSTASPYMPVVYAIDNPLTEKPEITTEKDKVIKIEGLAVFSGDQLKGYLNRAETRGVLWLNGDVKSGIISLNSQTEHNPGRDDTSIELKRQQTEIVPLIQGGKYSITAKIKAVGNVGCYIGNLNLTDPKAIAELERLTEEKIKEEIMMALNKALGQYRTDIFNFGAQFMIKYPEQQALIEKNWPEILEVLAVNLEVDFQIEKIGMVGTSK